MMNPDDVKLDPQTQTEEMLLGTQRDEALRLRLYRIAVALMFVYSVVISISAYVNSGTVPMPLYVVAGMMAVFNVLGHIKGLYRWAGPAFIVFLWLYVTSSGLMGFGAATYVVTGYLLVVVLVNSLMTTTWAIVVGAISLLSIAGLLNIDIESLARMGSEVTVLANNVGGPSNVIMAAILMIVQTRRTEATLLRTRTFANALDIRNRALETDVENRDVLLDERARYLQATAAIARESAAILTEQEEVMQQVVGTVSEQMDFYHTGLFLIDDSNTWAVLQSASSEGGRAMLERGHRLRVGSQGIVGYVAQTGRHRIAGDVSADAVFFNNPDLPETQSEIALPLVVRGRTIGVLDVQSQFPGAFSQRDVGTLQTLADQVAVAVYSAQMLAIAQEEAERSVREQERSAVQSWQSLLGQGNRFTFVSDEEQVTATDGVSRPEMQESFTNGTTVLNQTEAAPDSIAIPIRMRGEVVGVINARQKENTGTWTEDDITLLESLTDQLNIALEGAQLYEDSQRRAVRERLVREVTDQMRSAVTWEDLLQTAVQQMAETVQAPRAYVQWAVTETGVEDGPVDETNEEASNA